MLRFTEAKKNTNIPEEKEEKESLQKEKHTKDNWNKLWAQFQACVDEIHLPILLIVITCAITAIASVLTAFNILGISRKFDHLIKLFLLVS